MLDKAFAERIINDYKVLMLKEDVDFVIADWHVLCISSGTHVLYNYDKLQEIESKSLKTSDETAEATLQLVKAVIWCLVCVCGPQ